MKSAGAMLAIAVVFLGLAMAPRGPRPAFAQDLLTPQAIDTVYDRVIQDVCARCHNERLLRGNMSLEGFDVASAESTPELAERMIRKLRAGMMPPAGQRRPEEATLAGLAATLEDRLDAAATRNPDPGHRTFQRLNRAEYERSIAQLLGLEIDAGAYLPPDTKSANFDNIADVQILSATLMDAYLTAASEISRLAVGDARASPTSTTYKVPRYASQRTRVDGAPYGTRGGLSVVHNFPADGDYVFRLSLQHESTGNLFGQTSPYDEQIEVSVDGERMALLDVDRWMHVQDPTGVNIQTDPIAVRTGAHRVTAAFIQRFEGPAEDLVSPHGWSLADKKIGYSYGITSLPHLRDLAVTGPFDVTGVSETPVRERIFSCRPPAPEPDEPCAEEIIRRIGSEAYRRPLSPSDLAPLMTLYRTGRDDFGRGAGTDGGFETGIQTALQAILASPDHVFRFEEPGAEPDADTGMYPITDIDLAARLSFFLWSSPPDGELLDLAARGELSQPGQMEGQVRRMLADPRAEALATRFASQWLRLQDLDKVHPDALAFPDFHQQLADAMVRETELFFEYLVREDRSALDLLSADYTFVNERLARHYGVPDVTGEAFRRVSYPDDTRRGILGHGSVLTLTSHANRTSPVLRGKWVMEVLLGSPPPPPPPNVPDLEDSGEAVEGRMLTVREQLEMHRANPSCRSCHRMMDPIGLALENFDVTGRWRVRDNGSPIDVQGELYDGTPLAGPSDLRQALLERPEAFLRTFTENLLAYALGRRLEFYDMPTVRGITSAAAANDYRMTSFILGVVDSRAFRSSRAEAASDVGLEGVH